MKKYTWNDIINSNFKSIHIFWIWSLINKKTLISKKLEYFPWIIYWFKRIYNIKYPKSEFNRVQNLVYKNTNKKYNINNKNSWILNVSITNNKNDFLNWLIVKINKEDFKYYAKREYQYFLYQAHSYKIDPHTFKKEEKIYNTFILSAKKNYICKKVRPYCWYHNLCLKWAYNVSKRFWQIFEKTTYDINWNQVKLK